MGYRAVSSSFEIPTAGIPLLQFLPASNPKQ